MAYFEAAFNTTNVTTGQAAFEIIGSTTQRVRLLELSFVVLGLVGNACTIGLGRPAAAGVTPTSPITLVGAEVDDVATTQIATAWATSPTAPSIYMRRWTIPTNSALAAGRGAVWVFDPGIVLETSGPNNSLVVFNIANTSKTFTARIVVDEE